MLEVDDDDDDDDDANAASQILFFKWPWCNFYQARWGLCTGKIMDLASSALVLKTPHGLLLWT